MNVSVVCTIFGKPVQVWVMCPDHLPGLLAATRDHTTPGLDIHRAVTQAACERCEAAAARTPWSWAAWCVQRLAYIHDRRAAHRKAATP